MQQCKNCPNMVTNKDYHGYCERCYYAIRELEDEKLQYEHELDNITIDTSV